MALGAQNGVGPCREWRGDGRRGRGVDAREHAACRAGCCGKRQGRCVSAASWWSAAGLLQGLLGGCKPVVMLKTSKSPVKVFAAPFEAKIKLDYRTNCAVDDPNQNHRHQKETARPSIFESFSQDSLHSSESVN